MPIGATIGAAVVGAGAGIYSSSKAASAQKKAANSAASTELQVADKNNAFAEHMYDRNEGNLDPFINFGIGAGGNIMELLTGKRAAAPASTGTSPTTTAPKPATGYSGPGLGSIGSQAQMDNFLGYYRAHPEEDPGFTSIAPFHGDAYKDEDSANAVLAARQAYVASHPATPAPTTPNTQHPTNPAETPTPASSGNAAQSAWNTFKNSTQYQERLNTGLNSTASKYAAGGAFESGAEKKAINDYAQTFASNEIANYMDQLYRQEALGAGAASSLAGVGTNLVSQVSANNNNAASAAANAALVKGQGSANTWNAIGSGIGTAAGAIGGAFGSSYGGGGYDYKALQDSGIYDGSGWDF